MRTTKKDIYNSFGIMYNTKKQHIVTPVGECRPLLKKGNKKLGSNVWTWSTARTTCPCDCVGCYAKSGHYQRASVQNSLNRNTELARHYLDFLERALLAQLATLPDNTEVRIHAVGDFFCDDYMEMWRRVIKANPCKSFWTYTKVRKYEDAFNDLPNANIVKSFARNKVNFGHCDHVMALHEELKEAGEKVYVCPCGVDDNKHCEGCGMCSAMDYVLFLEHSTAYNAKKDPLYNEFCELVNNQ